MNANALPKGSKHNGGNEQKMKHRLDQIANLYMCMYMKEERITFSETWNGANQRHTHIHSFKTPLLQHTLQVYVWVWIWIGHRDVRNVLR